MIRAVFISVLLCIGAAASAQQLSGLAKVNAAASTLSETRRGLRLELALSQGVPYRVFTLDEPRRLVVDFREVDWRGLVAADLLDESRVSRASGVRFGAFRPGWSRLVVDLAEPMLLSAAEMRGDDSTGAAQLTLELEPALSPDFAAQSGAPSDANWGGVPADLPPKRPKARDGFLVVMLDPGHGGIDPGAERDGLEEKDLMLIFARELQEVLLRAEAFDVRLTRHDDSFVALERRVEAAHRAGADVFISLHADAVAEGNAHGATVHILSDAASDAASAQLAERHDRADMLAGVDLRGQDDTIANVLLDLARLETKPRAEQLAKAMVLGIKRAGGGLNRKPFRAAAYSVLKAADIPSVLIELGFMSSARDLENLTDPVWRARVAEGLRDGLQAWQLADAAARELRRQ